MMFPFRFLLLLAAGLIGISHSLASQPTVLYRFVAPHMGTEFQISLYASDPAKAKVAVEAAFERIAEIDRIASDYLPESELSRVNRAPAHQPIRLSQDLYNLLSKAYQTADQTDGAFDITAAYSVQLWRRSRRQGKLPSSSQIAASISRTDWKALRLDPANHTLTKLKEPLLLDLGGIGKGYAADAALAVLRDGHGIHQALVAASGDLAIGDAPPGQEGWKISLRTFEASTNSAQVILKNCGCSTSGDLHQFVEIDGVRYSHIVDPKTGLGLTKRIACTVIAPDATTSDAMDTALSVQAARLSPAELIDRYSKLSLRISHYHEGSITTLASPHFPPLVE